MPERQATAEGQNQLLARIARHDLAALEEFYEQTSGPIFSIAFRILGEAAEAEEVVQDVFVQIWEKAPAFDPALGSAFHWALSITRHRSIDRLRARQRRARLVEDLQDSGLADELSGADSSVIASDIDDAIHVRAVLKSLPPEQRLAIEMAFFGGKTHQQIAQELGEPVGTIKARIRRGMLKMRDGLRLYIW